MVDLQQKQRRSKIKSLNLNQKSNEFNFSKNYLILKISFFEYER